MASLAYQSMPTQFSFLEGPAPEFVQLDDKYICVYCKKLLKQPVQTMCGHRICSQCFEQMLVGKESVMCPGGDDYCETLTNDTVRN